MAAARQKKRMLMPEEKLDEALIPNTEEPYSVPSNWCWTKMGVVAKWGSGGTPSRKNDDYYNGTIPWVKTGELDDDFIWETEEHISEQAIADSGAKLFPINTIIIAMYGATIGKVGILGLEATTNQACACGVSSAALLYKYLFYYARSQKEAFIGMGKGGAQPNISQEIIKEHPIPLPPLTEQQRIVDRIESLFTKLDEAKEKAQAVVDGFEDRKAAILHKAFTGELTEKWRCTHKHSSKEWDSIPFEECIDTMQNGIAKRKGTEGEPFIVIRLANLSDDSFLEDDLREIVLDEKERHNYELHQDDVIMIRVNGSKENVGKQYRVTNQKKWAFCDHLIRIHYSANVVTQYIVYYSKTKEYRQYIMDNMVSSAGQNTISRKGLSRLQLPIPSIEEQKEIVSLLDSHFEKENQAIDTAKKVIDQIDTMKKTVLTRAFRGKLGTNDPNDESAIELLKKVLSVETTPQPRKKGVTLPKEIAGELKTGLERKIVKLFIRRETDSLPAKELMSVSSKPFDVLETLHDLEKRLIIKRVENNSNTYELMR